MATTLYEQKIDRFFGMLDVTKDQFLANDDVVKALERVVSTQQNPPAPQRVQALKKAGNIFWTHLVTTLDVDHDERISPAEFREGMAESMIHRDKFDKMVKPVIEACFQIVDTNGDDAVTMQEYQTLHRALGRTEKDATESFRVIDTDGDGQLTKDEFVEIAREYYTSEDPKARGNQLYGPL